MKTFSMRYFLRKPKGQQTDAKLFMRVNVRGKITDFSLNRKIRESDWDQDTGKPRGRNGTAKELERFMATLEEKLYAIERSLIEKNIPVTSQELVRHFTQAITGKVLDNRKTLSMIFDIHNKQVFELCEKGQVVRPTYSRYVTTQRYFSEFLNHEHKKADIPLADLQPGDIYKFDHWLKTTKDCEHNTALKYVKNLKKVSAPLRKTILHLLLLVLI